MRGKTKVPTEFLFSKIIRLNTGKLTSGESVYTSFGKTTKNGQHLKGLAF